MPLRTTRTRRQVIPYGNMTSSEYARAPDDDSDEDSDADGSDAYDEDFRQSKTGKRRGSTDDEVEEEKVSFFLPQLKLSRREADAQVRVKRTKTKSKSTKVENKAGDSRKKNAKDGKRMDRKVEAGERRVLLAPGPPRKMLAALVKAKPTQSAEPDESEAEEQEEVEEESQVRSPVVKGSKRTHKHDDPSDEDEHDEDGGAKEDPLNESGDKGSNNGHDKDTVTSDDNKEGENLPNLVAPPKSSNKAGAQSRSRVKTQTQGDEDTEEEADVEANLLSDGGAEDASNTPKPSKRSQPAKGKPAINSKDKNKDPAPKPSAKSAAVVSYRKPLLAASTAKSKQTATSTTGLSDTAGKKGKFTGLKPLPKSQPVAPKTIPKGKTTAKSKPPAKGSQAKKVIDSDEEEKLEEEEDDDDDEEY